MMKKTLSVSVLLALAACGGGSGGGVLGDEPAWGEVGEGDGGGGGGGGRWWR